MLKRLSVALVITLAASGCVEKIQTAKEKVFATPPSERKLATLNETNVGFSPISESDFDIKQDILDSRKYNQAVIDAPEYTDYLNDILGKLTEPVPEFSPKPTVFIVSDEGYNAVTRANGGIFIPIDTLSNLRSEDEVAALLAHEVSHLILGHFSSEKNRELTDKLMDSAMQMALTMETLKGETSYSKTLKLFAADYLIQSSLFPAWNRETEESADLLGLDLMLAAGYSVEGMLEFVKRIGIHEESNKLELSNYINNQMSTEDGFSGSVQINLGGMLESGLKKLNDQLSSNYKDSEARFREVTKYYSTFYEPSFPSLKVDALAKLLNEDSASRQKLLAFKAAKISSRALSGDSNGNIAFSDIERLGIVGISGVNKNDSYARMVMSSIRQHQNKTPTALKNLDIAINSQSATQAVYYKKYALLSETGDHEKANETLHKLEAEFGESDTLLPEKIDLALKQANKVEANKLFADCMASSFTGKSYLMESCKLAIDGGYLPRQTM
jgi:predicted Zn-dependent protease